MKEFEFVACCNYGPGDSGETYLNIDLSDEEASRLESACADPDIYYGQEFCKYEPLSDIYKKVYARAIAEITSELKYDCDFLPESIINDPFWRADDLYYIWIDFPGYLEPQDDEEEA